MRQDDGTVIRPAAPAFKVAFSSVMDVLVEGRHTAVSALAAFCNGEDRLPSFVGSPSPALSESTV